MIGLIILIHWRVGNIIRRRIANEAPPQTDEVYRLVRVV
jgi:hypothetical protein